MEKQKEFLFSIVMAVYNAEHYLDETMESILQQEIGFKDNIQVIMVNDGSSDRSGAICDEYQALHPGNIIALHKENGGAATARNMGLEYVTGKYINFLDSDDKLSLNTMNKVVDFFSDHSDETDMVVIPMYFFDGQEGSHWQNWKFNQGTRVIDLLKEPETTAMSTASSFIHSRRKQDIYFDPQLATAEDAKVNLALLYPKLRLGVIHDASYMYRREAGGDSLVQSSVSKKEWYTGFVPHYVKWAYDFYQEKMGVFPGFVQYTLLCDYQWRIFGSAVKANPLTEKEREEYFLGLEATLSWFEDRFILSQKMIFIEHKLFLLMKKYGRQPQILQTKGEIYLTYNHTQIWRQSSTLLNILFLDIVDNILIIEGRVRLYQALNEKSQNIQIVAQWGTQRSVCSVQVDKTSAEDDISASVLQRLLFKGEIPLNKDQSEDINIYICTEASQVKFTNFAMGKFLPVQPSVENGYYFKEGWILTFRKGILHLSSCDSPQKRERKLLRSLWKERNIAAKKAALGRLVSLFLKKLIKEPIFLISDRVGQAGDNGEALFRYMNEETKYKPFFAISKESPDYMRMKKIGRVVPFGGWRYKLLTIMGATIISSHGEDYIYNPYFDNGKYYADRLVKNRLVFLQHGITKDDQSLWLNRYNKNFDIFVTATYAEYDSISKGNYYFTSSEVKLTGLPRYDLLDSQPQKKITIIPTWRQYLTSGLDKETGEWGIPNSFAESSYANFYQELLGHQKLLQCAQKHGYELQFLPHPNMRKAPFELNDQVTLVSKDTPYNQIFSESDMILTDYSSVAFDFAYLKKPLIYCQFDSEEFFSGDHTYDKGYFDYEKDGFGEVTSTVQETVDLLIEYIENECRLKPKYKERIENTFAFFDQNNSKRVLEEIEKL